MEENALNSKKTIYLVLAIFALVLAILPFLTTFSEALTSLFLRLSWYQWIEKTILPFETRMIAMFLSGLGWEAQAGISTVSIFKDGSWQKILISWNCIGWQSLLVFLITAVAGLQGPFKTSSKWECFLIGLLGTIWVNIARLALVVVLIVYVNAIPANVAHDYASAFILILWLLFFWWFSYSFVLETKAQISADQEINAD